MSERKLSVFERLVLSRMLCTVPNPSGCWFWEGARDAKGYGFIKVDGRCRRVHIVAWELATGRKLKWHVGMTVNHTCRNPACWRPSHLEMKSRSWNTADGNRNRAKGAAVNAHPT